MALGWLQRFGPAALLLSWLPIVGDLMCVLAGWLRMPWGFVAFSCFGKSIALHRVNDDYVARDRLVVIIDVTNLRSHIYAVSVC